MTVPVVASRTAKLITCKVPTLPVKATLRPVRGTTGETGSTA